MFDLLLLRLGKMGSEPGRVSRDMTIMTGGSVFPLLGKASPFLLIPVAGHSAHDVDVVFLSLHPQQALQPFCSFPHVFCHLTFFFS